MKRRLQRAAGWLLAEFQPSDALILAGLGLASLGAYQMAPPLGYVAGGLSAAALGLLAGLRG